VVDLMEAQQEARFEVRGTRFVFGLTCNWCGGHGYEPTEDGDVVSCSECHGSGVEMQYTIPYEEKHYA